MVNARLGSVQASLVQADAHTVARTQRQICRSVTERLYLCAPLDGNVSLTQDNRNLTVGPGELMAFDNTRAYSLNIPQSIRMLILTFSHEIINLKPGDTHQLTAHGWSSEEGVSALLSYMIVGLGRHLTELSVAAADELGRSIAILTSTLFAERLNATVADPSAMRHALRLRIQAFARSRLSNPQLDPQVLAASHNISLRYLQLLFQDQGISPARWIRHERLSKCAEDLRNPSFAHLTVAMIGERWGLPSASHFSHLFRERYGVTPREFRRGQQLAA
jgi:AraC-like DNA-binding protein